MKTNYKPEHYNAISPYFIVSDAQKLVDQLKHIFNAIEMRRFNHEDGSIQHIELMIDDSVIMLSGANTSYPPNQLLVHVYVPDVQETFKKAIQEGCEVIEKPVQKKGDPDMRGMFKDCQGNIWAIGTQVINN